MHDSKPVGAGPHEQLPYSALATAILVLFFLSGACTLIYEVVWVRLLVLVFGMSVFAVSTVLSAFMAGLAIGSWSMNRRLARCGWKHLAALEFAMATFAAILPVALWALANVNSGLAARPVAEAGVGLLTLILAVLVGMEFPLAAKTDFQKCLPARFKFFGARLILVIFCL